MTQFTENDMKPTTDEMFKLYKTFPQDILDYLMNPSSYEFDKLKTDIVFWACVVGFVIGVFIDPAFSLICFMVVLLKISYRVFNYLKKVERYVPAMRARILTWEHYDDFILSKTMSVEEYNKKWNVAINKNTKLWTLEELSPISNILYPISNLLIVIGCISLYILLLV